MTERQPSRRIFLRLAAGVPTGLALALRAGTLPATPACADPADPTPPQTAGPYFKPESPRRTAIVEVGDVGSRLVLTGRVLTRTCRPVAGALLDFWQADGRGAYDLSGFRLRGHQFADDLGRYHLETVRPGLYPGRTRHIHVRVQPPGGPVLTTQLYFPGEPANARDGLFAPALLVASGGGPGDLAVQFDFVV